MQIGSLGVGEMLVTNGIAVTGETDVAAGTNAVGSLTVSGGTMTISSNLTVAAAPGSTGTVIVTEGKLETDGSVVIGKDAGSGQLKLSNISPQAGGGGGVIRFNDVKISDGSGSDGSLVISNGTMGVTNFMVVGDCGLNVAGEVEVAGGSFFVTNANHTAFLEVRAGLFEVLSGTSTVMVDRIVMTNTCGRLIRYGGTLQYGQLMLSNDVSATGDGIPNGWKLQYGLDPFLYNVGSLDSDGDGLSNLQEYQTGTNPTNSASAFRIVSVAREGNNMRVTWAAVGGRSYVVQTNSLPTGSSFTALSPTITMPSGGESTTNYLHLNAGSAGALLCRIRTGP